MVCKRIFVRRNTNAKGNIMYRTIAIAACVAVALGFAGAIAAPVAKPTDPQIAHIAYTADQLDIEAGKLALDKSKNQDVRAFAQRMVGDHTAVNDQAVALLKKLNVTPEDNPKPKPDPSAGCRAQKACWSGWCGVRQGLCRQRGGVS
jgi:Domain of unknown function (DUF4142)